MEALCKFPLLPLAEVTRKQAFSPVLVFVAALLLILWLFVTGKRKAAAWVAGGFGFLIVVFGLLWATNINVRETPPARQSGGSSITLSDKHSTHDPMHEKAGGKIHQTARPHTEPEYYYTWKNSKYRTKDGSLPEWLFNRELLLPERRIVTTPARHFSVVQTDSKNRLAGYSTFHSTENEAVAEAYKHLLDRIKNHILYRLYRERRRIRGFEHAGIEEAVSKKLNHLKTELETSVYTDEVEAAAGAGTVYMAAVVTRFPQERFTEKAASASIEDLKAQKKRQHRRHRGLLFSVAGGLFLLFITMSIYLSLNMWTRGYYTWLLRITGIILYAGSMVSYLFILKYIL